MARNGVPLLSSLNSFISKACVFGVAFNLAVICVIMFSAVVARYLFNAPISWGEDATGFLLVWMVLLGAPVGLRNKEHVAIDIMIEKWPPTLRATVQLAADFVIAFVAVVIVLYGFPFSLKSMNSVLSSIDWLKYGYMYLALPIGYGLLFLVCLEQIVQDFAALFGAAGKRS